MEDLPRDPRCPTPTAEHLVPVPFHKAIYPAEGSQVSREPIVRVVATKGLIEPTDLILQRPVPNVTHELPEGGQAAAKSRLLRFPANLVVAVAVAIAVVAPAFPRRLRSGPGLTGKASAFAPRSPSTSQLPQFQRRERGTI